MQRIVFILCVLILEISSEIMDGDVPTTTTPTTITTTAFGTTVKSVGGQENFGVQRYQRPFGSNTIINFDPVLTNNLSGVSVNADSTSHEPSFQGRPKHLGYNEHGDEHVENPEAELLEALEELKSLRSMESLESLDSLESAVITGSGSGHMPERDMPNDDMREADMPVVTFRR